MSFNQQKLIDLAEIFTKNSSICCEKIPQSGSNRLYFRLTFESSQSVIGVYNEDIRENIAFFYFTNFFLEKNIRVPQIYTIDAQKEYYLLEDLGDETLFSFLTSNRKEEILSPKLFSFYEKTVKQLPKLQFSGKEGINFNICYPRAAFDRQSMQWDLNYFKYYFLKLAHIHFDEQFLEDDFNTLIDYLLEVDSNYFLFRDFQSRNIMIHKDEIYFIDYQGGRRGALQYDIASLLYDGKANLAPQDREKLLHIYLDGVEKLTNINREDFLAHYDSFVLIRILQALGTYGYRGYYEKKSHFLLSIPYAQKNLKWLLEKSRYLPKIPTLLSIIEKLTTIDFVPFFNKIDKLTVEISSFSYKKEIPQDFSGNGGGFVFDCRALPNPGREKKYAELTGKDIPVIEYLEKHREIAYFKEHIFAIVDLSIDNYLERKFTHLMVNFGCTGGQHRSVYFAESLRKHCIEKYGESLRIELQHTNL